MERETNSQIATKIRPKFTYNFGHVGNLPIPIYFYFKYNIKLNQKGPV